VASIERDMTLPGDYDDPSLGPTELYKFSARSRITGTHAPRPQCAVNWDQNLKPKLAIMHQCTSITDRQTDGH